jgi:hypothetical protein
MKRKPGRKMKAIPRQIYEHNGSSVTFRYDSIDISGKIEDAAWAMAQEILTRAKSEPTTHWDYMFGTRRVMEATFREGCYNINLIKHDAIDPDTWATFKKDVEKICNKLIAFM